MSWEVTIPGHVPSGNHAHKIGRGFRRGGIAFPKMVKTDEAVAYQAQAALIVKAARPSNWKWDGRQVIVEYRMFLDRDADATNIIKTLEDAVFPALGIDDKFALPRAMSKEVVPPKLARVTVTIY